MEIQERLIHGITRAEYRIRCNKADIAILKRKLAAERPSREESVKLRSRIEAKEAAVFAQQRLVSIYRDIGDSIAFIYADRFDLKQFCNKPPSGAISGKKGNRLERAALRCVFKDGFVAVLNDLTHSLRHADITVFSRAGTFALLEMKSGAGGNVKRAARQEAAANQVLDYLRTDVRQSGDSYTVRQAFTQPPKYHVAAINELVRKTRAGTPWAWRAVESGLVYAVLRKRATSSFWEELPAMKRRIVMFANDMKGAAAAYYPFPLIFDDPEAIASFYEGDFVIAVLVDLPPRVRVGSYRLDIELVADPRWPLQVTPDGEGTAESRGVLVGSHFFNRLAAEFMGRSTLLRHAASRQVALEGSDLLKNLGEGR